MRLLSLNIETDYHFERFIPYVKEKNPDVVLLQEVLDKDMTELEIAFGMPGIFTPLNYLRREKDTPTLGIATFTSLPIVKKFDRYYYGNATQLPIIEHGQPEKMARAILVTELRIDNTSYCIVNTHFTWSPNGKPNAAQHKDVKKMLAFLKEIPEFILCGDFNAPRGTDIFEIIASQYKDNIPLDVTTTLDKNLHYAGGLNLVVDGFFTTPIYHVETIQVVDGLSDHCALLAEISKR
jgi:endonuclease/exonuclease/phosphatase family metal-dependent hydrolase